MVRRAERDRERRDVRLDRRANLVQQRHHRGGPTDAVQAHDLGACIGLGATNTTQALTPEYVMGEYATLPNDVKNWAADQSSVISNR